MCPIRSLCLDDLAYCAAAGVVTCDSKQMCRDAYESNQLIILNPTNS